MMIYLFFVCQTHYFHPIQKSIQYILFRDRCKIGKNLKNTKCTIRSQPAGRWLNGLLEPRDRQGIVRRIVFFFF